MTKKATPRALRVRTSLPPGSELQLSEAAAALIVRMFGQEAIRRVIAQRPTSMAPAGNPTADDDAERD